MIKSILLIMFLLMGACPLKAQDASEGAQDLPNDLDNIRNPFEEVAVPKPPEVLNKPIVQTMAPKTMPVQTLTPPVVTPKPVPVVAPVILPALKLDGVIVGGDIQEAIINDKVISVSGTIEGAKIISVTKQGVNLIYKHKKFFLKVE